MPAMGVRQRQPLREMSYPPIRLIMCGHVLAWLSMATLDWGKIWFLTKTIISTPILKILIISSANISIFMATI